MKLNNIDVVRALFESYLHIRKESWGINVNDPSKSKLNDKLKFCGNILADLHEANTVDGYIKVLDTLAQKEKQELQELQDSWGRKIPLFNFIYDKPMLYHTVCAAKIHLLSQLRELVEFKSIVSKLEAENSASPIQSLLPDSKVDASLNANKKLWLDDLKDFNLEACEKNFSEITLQSDNRTRVLAEQSFLDFEKNVLTKIRVLDERLLHAAKVAVKREASSFVPPLKTNYMKVEPVSVSPTHLLHGAFPAANNRSVSLAPTASAVTPNKSYASVVVSKPSDQKSGPSTDTDESNIFAMPSLFSSDMTFFDESTSPRKPNTPVPYSPPPVPVGRPKRKNTGRRR